MLGKQSAFSIAMLAAGSLALAACGGDSGDKDGQSSTMGRVSFSVTDAPVDDASAVVIAMTEFELKPSGGEPFKVPADPEGRQLNLLDFTNGAFATIIEDEEVPAGDYEWLRIFFDEEQSYIELEEGGEQYRLFVPSGAQTGFKLQSGFTVPANDSVEYMLDFNLRHSVIEPKGQGGPFGSGRVFLLKPVVLIMNVEETGGVEGVVADDLLDLHNDEPTCFGGNAVYAFEGHDVDALAEPPLVTDIVDLNEGDGQHEYHLMFLLPGPYTLAFTCSANADDGDVEAYPHPDLSFSEQINVTVVSGEIKVCDIPPGEEQADPC